ncbi:B-cell receptor CD22-like isoform X2 [Ctenopharyngodon idella]|uniref:B-cell receptor CD22-like isoform X2 n=1 Tax=Ctenopharyngodon idella TaxID=7959 RepID=UPI0022318C7C|nr:B-cell receptor CD22-like isoform X2 [Ctenopharyngodon idella]
MLLVWAGVMKEEQRFTSCARKKREECEIHQFNACWRDSPEHGVSSAGWGVSYSPSHICALNDSSVIMRCTYTYPTGYQIKNVFWTKAFIRGEKPPDLSEDPEYSQRLQYLGDKQQNCTIRLSHVTLKDSRMYYFRFITDKPDGKWIGDPGVTLAVTDLQVESPERVTEGDSVRLTCNSSCTLTDRATFIWYRNSQPLTERRDRNNELLLQSVRREDAGRYSCAVHGHNHISPAVELNVTYPPKSVSVSISPSGEIVSGDSVTLICSSDSNPPALNFSWFKGRTFVGSGRIYSISKISSDDSGEYKCRSRNQHGEKYSDAVTLNVMWVSSADWGVSYSPSHICALKNSSVIMSCTYTYPTGYQIKNVFWTKAFIRGEKPPDLSEDPEYSQRLQYLGDKQQNCTIRLSHVTLKDSRMYYFRFITDKPDGKWIGDPGVTLTVTDLQVESPERVTEGDSVHLTCNSSCTLTDRATFIWYRNSQPLTERRDRNNELLLQSVRREDAGRYSCAVHGHNHISPAVELNVTYPPKSVSVSISPSGEIVSGDSVTLICSSDSNPPAEISWFKGRTFVGSGRIYSISKISSDDSGEYKCRSRNQHGEKYSDAVTLNVMWVSSAGWGVSYSPSHICALKNSSVIMSCTYTYPTGYQIMRVFWTKDPVKEDGEYLDLSEDPEYSQRLQYLGDKQQNCTIRLSHVTLNDSRMYYFRFITNITEGKWIGKPGVTLAVTDLQVSQSPERVTEGDSVRLTCNSSCTLTDRATFIWYRNSQPLTERRDRNNELLLQSVRREDAGRYTCAVHGHNHISPAVELNVMYPPKSVSVSISPSGEIVSGDSVTLICSSDSNPPALNFSWFKGGTFVGSGRIYNISKISSDDSGEYKCRSRNQHGEKYSDAVTLNVMYPPRNVSVLINGSGEIVSGDSVTLICSSDSNPPALNFSWFKENESSAVGSGQSFSALQSGRFYCQAHNQHGSQRSDAVTVTVHHRLSWHVWLGISVACVGFFIIIIIILFIIKRRDVKAEDLTAKQDNLYSDVTGRDVHVSESADFDDAQYTTVAFSKPRRDRNTPDRRDSEEIQYATVQHHKNKQTKRSEENESQYDNIRIHQPESAVRRSNVETMEEASVIYSCVK